MYNIFTRARYISVSVDDIFVFSNNTIGHIEQVHFVFDYLSSHSSLIRVSKSRFVENAEQLCEFIVPENGNTKKPSKAEAAEK